MSDTRRFPITDTTRVTVPPNLLHFALSWALAAMDDDFMELQESDYHDPEAVVDATKAKVLLQMVYDELDAMAVEP
jgi:hypothetical protein